jgi:large subunit ribosomal protein L46
MLNRTPIESSRHPRFCSDCISSLSRHQRQYATAAAAPEPSSEGASPSHTPPVTSTNAIAPYIVKSGILLSRPPLITKALTPFEKAFYFYQKRLNERLAMPFTRYFYFKKDTPADNDWKRKAIERNGSAARELGGYQPYGELGWNDEVLVGDKVSEPRAMVETLIKDAVMRVEGEEELSLEAVEANVERPMERWTEADKARDMKRLDRKLARTLYLLVKGKSGKWGLPNGTLVGRENLHQVRII